MRIFGFEPAVIAYTVNAAVALLISFWTGAAVVVRVIVRSGAYPDLRRLAIGR